MTRQRAKKTRTGFAGTLAIALVGAAALAAPSASAEAVHVIAGTIANHGNNAAERPRGIAVDANTGDIWVADTQHARVLKFAADGTFLRMMGVSVNEGTGDPNLCTNAGAPTDICKKQGDYFGGRFDNLFHIAVDSTNGPSAGDVYPVSIGDVTQKFDPTGHLVTSWGGNPVPGTINGSTAPGGPFNGGYSPDAVDTAGNLHVLNGQRIFSFAQDGSSPSSIVTPVETNDEAFAVDGDGNYFQSNQSDGTIEKISAAGVDLGRVSIPAPSEFMHTSALAYDPGRDDLFAVRSSYAEGNHARVDRYRFNGSGQIVEADGSTCAPAPAGPGCPPSETFGTEDLSTGEYPMGIAVNWTSGTVYVANTGSNNVKVFTFFDAPKISNVTTANLKRDSVEFKGHVDPDGAGEVISCKFEYGTTTEYKTGTVPCSPGSTTTPSDVSSALPSGSLQSQTTYHYRLVVGNSGGVRPAPDNTFTTPFAVAGVTTDGSKEVGRLSAVVEGSFGGDGVDTSYHFEYGPTSEYGFASPDVDLGTATGTQPVAATLGDLLAFTEYHYRLITHNQYGTTIGPDKTFHTLEPDLPSVLRTFTAEVGSENVALNAEIDPGEGLTVYRFEYGTSTGYGTKTLQGGPIDPNGPSRIGTSSLSGLAPGTTYHYRAIASNFKGTVTGPDQTFTTSAAPEVISSSSSAISQTTATLSAMVNPRLALTTYHFEFGPTAGYGSSTPESAPFGPDTAEHAVSAAIASLAPGTTYHFRVVAANPVGAAFGADQTFTTVAATTPSGANPPPAKLTCKKGFVKKRGKCARKHRTHKKSNGHRGGTRG